jgi:hypothetical protein
MKKKTTIVTKRRKTATNPVSAVRHGNKARGFLAGKGAIRGNVVSPAMSRKEWGELRQ